MANVPNTNTFTLQDVYNAVYSHNVAVQSNLNSCFLYSTDSYFDINYKGAKDRMSNFRNYTVPIGGCPNVGDSYGGGIVAYKFVSGDPGYIAGECHGIIISAVDIYTSGDIGARWSITNTNITTSTTMGTGVTNTTNIINNQGTGGAYAALGCRNYTAGGFTWSLPSIDDLNAILVNWSILGLQQTGVYWSSSNCSLSTAWDANAAGSACASKSNNARYVRAIRYF